jgi:vacuolar-type H+-ATPase subunit H
MSQIAEERVFQYDKGELRKIIFAMKNMDEQSVLEAKAATGKLVEYAVSEIKQAASDHPRPKQARRIADGVRISKSSRIGEFSLGFAGQKFSGGATTQLNEQRGSGRGILAGVEFGSNNLKQFQARTPTFGPRGNKGYFIWNTLRRIQPEIIKQWEESFAKIYKKWDD